LSTGEGREAGKKVKILEENQQPFERMHEEKKETQAQDKPLVIE